MIESSVSWVYECDVDDMEESLMDDVGRIYIWVLRSEGFWFHLKEGRKYFILKLRGVDCKKFRFHL